MSRDKLEDLLGRADAEFPPQSGASGLVDRVRARALRRARAQVALVALGSVAIAAIVLHSAPPQPMTASERIPARKTSQVDTWRAELAGLEATAELHQRTAEDLMAVERRAEVSRQIETELLPAQDPLSYLQEARDRAARVMLMDAKRLRTLPGGEAQAAEIDRRAEQLFPDTDAVRETMARLKRSDAHSKGDSIHA